VWYFHNVFRFVFVCNVFWVEFQQRRWRLLLLLLWDIWLLLLLLLWDIWLLLLLLLWVIWLLLLLSV
jgi:hypothetical protein